MVPGQPRNFVPRQTFVRSRGSRPAHGWIVAQLSQRAVRGVGAEILGAHSTFGNKLSIRGCEFGFTSAFMRYCKQKDIETRRKKERDREK